MKNNLLFSVLISLALVAGLSLAQAQNRVDYSGSYTITGTNPDGSTYAGKMTVVIYGDGYRVTQTFSDGTVYQGIGNDMGNYFTVAYQSGNVPTISIYKVTQPRALEGFWQDYNDQKEGQETAVLATGPDFTAPKVGISSTRYDYTGVYTVNGTNPDGSTYSGVMAVSAYGDGYRVTQTFADGTVWRGVGNDIADYFAVSYQTSTGPSVQIYQRDRSNNLKGYWQNYGDSKEGQETAIRR